MKEFLITAYSDFNGKSFAYGREFADSLLEAWLLFESHRCNLYPCLYFHSAVSDGKYYSDLFFNYMKEFSICASIDRKGNRLIFGVEHADNLRDAWRFFKSSHSMFSPLYFHSASCGDKYYFKIY